MATVRIRNLPDGRLAAGPSGFLDKGKFALYLTACRRAGAQYDAAQRAQVLRRDDLPRLIQSLHCEGFSFEAEAALQADLEQAAAAANDPAEAADAALAEAEARLPDGVALYPFQRQGVRWMLTRPEAGLLADAMGTGKSCQTLAALPEKAPVLVVAPAAVKGVWKREAAKWRPTYTVEVLAGRSSFRWPAPGEVVITNPAILPKAYKEGKYYRLPQAIELGVPQGTWVILDECHAYKTPKAQRTRSARCLGRLVRRRGGKVLGLTGTPLLNRPPELWHVLHSLGIAVEAFGSFDKFKQACSARRGRFGLEWGTPDRTVAENLRKVSLRRSREEVLPDLPIRTWETLVVNGLTKEAQEAADAAMAAIRAAGIDLDSETAAADLTRDGAVFAELSRARKALANSRIPAMLDLIEDYEEQGEPVVVFSAHRGPIDTLSHREGWAVITGDVPADKRSSIVDKFQSGELRGIGLTIAAGGTGITLTRAHLEIFVDRDWTPAMNDQAECRCVRIGQTRGVIIRTLVSDHDVDIKVQKLLDRKQRLFAATVEASEVRVEEAPKGNGTKVKISVIKNAETLDCRNILTHMETAAKDISWPRLTGVYKGQRVRIQYNRQGREPGSISVTDGASFYGGAKRRYFGKIGIDGMFQVKSGCTEVVKELLEALNADFAGVAGDLGRGLDACCFCGRALTDDHSIKAGCGPHCAQRFGVPWGGE
jgi:SWI/SNF-related matrix-associated actin-dependent regulator 1 of chromatin subfamily A